MTTLEELRGRARNAQRDMALLAVLRPEDVFTADNPEGLSMRRDSPKGARYRTVLDKTLDKYGSKAAFQNALALPAPTSPLHPGEWALASSEQPVRPQNGKVTMEGLRARAAGMLAPDTAGQGGSTLEGLKARTAHLVAPKEPSALENFYEGAIKAPARNLYAGYLQSGGGLYDLGANVAMIARRLGSVDREGKPAYRETEAWLREQAENLYGESLQYMDDNILAKVYQGLGAAPAAIAELISGTRLLRSAPAAFSAVEALHAADKGPKEVALAAARGALTGKAFEAAAPLTRPMRVGALTTIGAGQGAAAGGDVEDITAGAATLGILGLTGGRGHVTLRDLRRRAAKAQRQETAIALPRATPEDVLELTERVEPTTPYTARVIREPSGAPTPLGRPAERGEPFERPKTLANLRARVDRELGRQPQANRGARIEPIPAEDIQVDAEMFQFKADTDTRGVSSRLQGVTEFDERLAGLSLVYEFEDGRRFIVDGHQRLALAQRIMARDPAQDIRLNSIVLHEADGITPGQARSFAAGKNIAEGTGTAVDAAKIIRESPADLPPLPPRSALVSNGRALAKLGDEAFGMVANGRVKDAHAAVVGRLVPDESFQVALLRLLAKTEPASVVEAESIVRQGIAAGFDRRTEATLFGEQEIVDSLFGERAKILSRALTALRKDRATFNTLVSRESDILGAGNVLDRASNVERLSDNDRALATLQALANRKGPVSDALTEAARDARSSGNFGKATARFTGALKRAIHGGVVRGGESGGPGRSVGHRRDVRGSPEEAKPAAVAGAFQDLGDGFAIRQRSMSDGRPIQEIRTPEGDIVRRGIDTRGQAFFDIETDRPPTAEVLAEIERKVQQRFQGAPRLTAEPTPQGIQTVLPGAERTSGREFVEAQADKRIKGTTAQKPADEGLFDVAGRGQGDIVDLAKQAPSIRPRTIETPRGPVEVAFPDELHAQLFDLVEGRPDKTAARALYDRFKGFVLERFDAPADVIALAREYRAEVLDAASTGPGRQSHAPLVIDPDRQAAYFMREKVGPEAADLYTFPGPISGLKKQWHRAATEIIDWLAEGRYSPAARYFGGYPFKDPTMGHLPERAEYLGKRGETQGAIYRTNRAASRLNDALRKAPVEDQRAALDYLTTEGADPKSLPSSVRGAAVAAKSAIKRVGRELVRRGMLSQEAYDAHADAYLPRVYLKHLMERSGFGAGLKISDQGYLKKRTDLPEEYRDLYLGEIKDVGFLVTKAISQPARDLAMTDFLRDLSQNPEWVLPESIVEWTAPGMKTPRKVTPYWLKSEAGLLRRRADAMPDLEQRARAKEIADGMDTLADDALGTVKGVPKDFRRMPDSPRYGDLRGLVVRKEIHDDIVGASGVWVGEKGAYDKTFDKLGTFNAFWKMMKVPFNPPTQIRNMVSNAVLLDLSGVPAQRLPALYVRAFNEIRNNRKYYRIAVKHGIPASTFTAEELYRIRPDLLRVRGEKGGVVGKLAKMGEPLARLASKPGDLYQFSETLGKVVKIIDAMEREGLSETKAVAAAQEALFDYSLVPNLVRSLRTRAIGAPFITFYYKAFPAVMKGLIKHPGKFAKYLIIPYLLGDALVADLNDVTSEDVDKLRKALPGWLQDQGHVYLYPYRDESGRWDFVNFGYFLPWAMHERTARNAMELATGSYEGSVNDFMSQLGVLGGPVPQIGAAMMTGIDPFTGREIIKDTDPPREQIYKLMMYAWRMGGPSFLTDQGVAGHMQRSLTQTPNYSGDPPLSPEQAAGRAVGVNIYPVDPVQSRQRNIRSKTFEIRRIERDARRAMKNKGLSKERRADLREQYKARIDQLKNDLKRYREESRVHPNLRRGKAR